MKLYKNGLVLENGKFVQKDLLVDNGMIQEIAPEIKRDCAWEDVQGKRIIPALIDIHTHGANGFDFNLASLEQMRSILEFYIARGIGTVLPTVMTDTDEVMIKQLEKIRILAGEYPQIKGIHLEGPFLAMEYRGAMPEWLLQEASLEKFQKYQDAAGGLIRLVTVSPEVKGAVEFIKEVTKTGVVVSLGHSGADYEQTMACVEAGAKSFTHTLNAMRHMTQHAPNIAGAAYLSDNYCEVICDGKHIHPDVVRFLLKVKGLNRIIAITDSMMAAGLGDGEYKLGQNRVIVVDGDARIAETGTRAGSTLTIDSCLQNVLKFTGLPLEKALMTLTENPARLLGIFDKTGSLEVGKLAEFIIID